MTRSGLGTTLLSGASKKTLENCLEDATVDTLKIKNSLLPVAPNQSFYKL
jgi:hypothetical protein